MQFLMMEIAVVEATSFFLKRTQEIDNCLLLLNA